jgi:hypothetical protein
MSPELATASLITAKAALAMASSASMGYSANGFI